MAAAATPNTLTYGGPENNERRLACAAEPAGTVLTNRWLAWTAAREPTKPNHEPTKPTS